MINAKAPVLAALALACIPALAFLRPVAEQGGVKIAIEGFDETKENGKIRYAVRNSSEPFTITVAIENSAARPVSGLLDLSMNDDWELGGGPAGPVGAAPGKTERLSFTARARPDRAENGLYPVHARYRPEGGGELHAIALFEASGPKPRRAAEDGGNRAQARGGEPPPDEAQWTAKSNKAILLAQKAASGACEPGSFRLEAGGEKWGAAIVPGRFGALDGAIAFSNGEKDLVIRGFRCAIDGVPAGPGENSAPCLSSEVRAGRDGALEIVHSIAGLQGAIPAVLRVSAAGGALRLRWEMPGVERDLRGHPRYTLLGIGPASMAAERIYAGFGNVIERPASLSLRGGGFDLSTRHVGADYPSGVSLVQATDVFPERFVCKADEKLCSLETSHDAEILLLPSARGAFAAACALREARPLARSPAWHLAAGRMCLDQWGGDYDEAAEALALAAKYGLDEAFFVKHDWQRWGYDYRLPDIYPPRGDFASFMKMRKAAKDAGILFCLHDNYIDFYPDANGFSYDDIVFNHDGTPQKAWLNDGRGAQSYRWAPHRFMPFLRKNAAAIAEGAGADGIFIDVFTAMAPIDYFDRSGRFHPKTETAREWAQAFDEYRNFLAPGSAITVSEAGTDALAGHLDAAESDHFPASRWTGAENFADAERVPWHDMASHGAFVLLAGGLGPRYSATDWNHRGDERLHGYGSDDYLSNTVIGGRTPMCDGPFSRRAAVTYYLLHDVCKSLAFARFESHEFCGSIHRQHTVFSNGGEVWTNRDADSKPWQVGGFKLPRYGFYAKTPEAVAGIVETPLGRCAFAKAKDVLFADARPPHDECFPAAALSRATGAQATGRRCTVSTEWTIAKASPGYRPFVHVVPSGADDGKLLFQCPIALAPDAFERPGRYEAAIDIQPPADLAEGCYDIRYGAYRPADGRRLAIGGIGDGHARIKGGTIRVAKDPDGAKAIIWEPTAGDATPGANPAGTMIEFAWLKTDGAFRLRHPPSGAWQLIPLPGSRPFKAELDLGKLGRAGATVAAVKPVDPAGGSVPGWHQEGSKLAISADARAFAYSIEFAAP